MSCCDKCYECAPRCPRAADNTLQCVACLDDPLGERQPSGVYSGALGRASNVLSNISAPLADKLLGYKGPVAVVDTLTAEESTLFGTKASNYDGLSLTNLNVCLSLNRKRPAEYSALRQRVEALLMECTQAAPITKIETVLSILSKDIELHSKVEPVTTTATAYKEDTFPLYMFWHAILKKVVIGQDSFEEVEQKTLFDTASGKVHVPFEKMPKCKTPAHLFMAFAMFKEGITVLKQTAPRAWSGLETQVFRTESTMGFAIAQQFVGEVLRRLDLGDFPNIVSLMANGEHNRILDDLRPILPVYQPLREKDANSEKENDENKSKRIKLGAVTKQGEFCSIVKNKNSKPLLCMQFKQGKPCTSGVAAGQGHDQHVGKCAYHHE